MCAQKLIDLFGCAFRHRYQTILVSGGCEPEYIPAGSGHTCHRIIFSHDYCESALHEIAHWCVAGDARRLLRDYGYWYAPDGRTQAQQDEFELVEVKPQALEWVFANACRLKFRVSADNLAAGRGASQAFKQSIVEQAHYFCEQGLNARADLWRRQLAEAFGGPEVLLAEDYTLEAIT